MSIAGCNDSPSAREEPGVNRAIFITAATLIALLTGIAMKLQWFGGTDGERQAVVLRRRVGFSGGGGGAGLRPRPNCFASAWRCAE